MLTNAQLASFQALVDDELAAGRKGDAALEALKTKLGSCVVPSSDLVFETWESDSALPGHVLLCHTDMASMFVSHVYSHIAGGGRRYNGMFGDGELLRDPEAVTQLLKVDQEPAPIAEQVSLCLRVLDFSLGSIHPEIAQATRRHLGNILLDYPVLMHPAFIIPVRRSSGIEYVSVAYALAGCLQGGLPRLADLADVGRSDEVLSARLKEFATHPCTYAALNRSGMRAYATTTPSGRRGKPKFARNVLAHGLISHTGSHASFLASVMDLEELAGEAASDALPLSPSIRSIHLRPAMMGLMSLTAYGAMGVAHSGAIGTIPAEQLRHPRDPGFLAHLKRRLDTLRWSDTAEPFAQGFLNALQRRIFLVSRNGASSPLSVDVMLHQLRSVASGMVECGMADSRAAAAETVLQWTLGANRPSTNLPMFDASVASAFLIEIEQLGGFGWDEREVPGRIRLLLDDVMSVPARPIPYRDDWANALKAMAAERSMTSVLRRAGSQSKVPASDSADGPDQVELDFGAAPVPGSAAPRRRARASV